MNIKQIVYSLLLLIITGCAKNTAKLSSNMKVRIHKAKLADISTPFGAKPIPNLIGDYSFGFIVDKDKLDLVDYYLTDMEHQGWRLVTIFDGSERQLIFDKPHKFASINIRDESRNKSKVLILLSDKKSPK